MYLENHLNHNKQPTNHLTGGLCHVYSQYPTTLKIIFRANLSLSDTHRFKAFLRHYVRIPPLPFG